MLIAHFAVPLAGGVLVAMNVRLSPAEVGYISRHSGAKLLIVAQELLRSVPPAESLGDVSEVLVISDAGSDSAPSSNGALPLGTYEEFRDRGSLEPLPWTADDELATITIKYPSGTTGDPKGVSYTHRDLGRREHLHCGGGADAPQSPRRGRRCGGGGCQRTVGRAAQKYELRAHESAQSAYGVGG
jgi:acyl-CoA synthetase (AMP-forming)/AMP-acid ligase II